MDVVPQLEHEGKPHRQVLRVISREFASIADLHCFDVLHFVVRTLSAFVLASSLVQLVCVGWHRHQVLENVVEEN